MVDFDEQHRATVDVYGLSGIIDIKDDLFADFPAQTAALVSDVNEYWKNNVEKYFSKSLSYPTRVNLLQMRDACRITILKKTATSNGALMVEMAAMFNQGFDYSQVIINGRSPSEHYLYIPELGASIDVDAPSFEADVKSYRNRQTTRGTDNRAWLAWKKEFNTFVYNRMIGFVRQCIKAGLVRRKR